MGRNKERNTSVRILILDDTPYRHEVFARLYEGHEITSCYSYFGYLEALRSSPWDLVHLDHDLGNDSVADTYVDGWGNTRQYNGSHAAMRICELDDDKRPKEVIIQSVNPSGAQGMLQMLQRANVNVSWQPFSEPSWDLQAEQERKL